MNEKGGAGQGKISGNKFANKKFTKVVIKISPTKVVSEVSSLKESFSLAKKIFL